MKKSFKIARIEIIDGLFYDYDKNGNLLKLTRNQRIKLTQYPYRHITDHTAFQNDVQRNIGNGRKLIDDTFVFIKEGEKIYENIKSKR